MADTNFDMRDHKRTYSGFLALTKWGIVLITLLLIIMAATLV
jgi:Bacterial aa3 type cytochrome c oxidase subunit IV